jgi:integrase
VDEEIVERNPSRDLSLRHKPKASQARSNYFSTKQLYKLWYPAHEIKPTYLRFLRFMIVCPLRRSEAANLSAKNIFENEMELRLSAAETKNKEAFSLPLPDLAFTIWRFI